MSIAQEERAFFLEIFGVLENNRVINRKRPGLSSWPGYMQPAGISHVASTYHIPFSRNVL